MADEPMQVSELLELWGVDDEAQRSPVAGEQIWTGGADGDWETAGECVVVTTPGSRPGDLTLAFECGVEFLLQNLPPTWRYERDWPGKVHPHTPPRSDGGDRGSD